MINIKTWITPSGQTYKLFHDMLEQDHLLIGGATGSGKSVLLNGLIYTALYDAPCDTQLVLIDPKRVELVQYKFLPHVIRYASESEDIISALKETINIMESRYRRMQRQGKRKSDEPRIYVIIDEFADLITTSKKAVLPLLCRIAQLGRAARIHLFIATQRPTRDIINGQIKVNLNSRVALRCPTKQDSRNIIERNGAETLPLYGYGYYMTPASFTLTKIPLTEDEEIIKIINHWMSQTEYKKTSFLQKLKGVIR